MSVNALYVLNRSRTLLNDDAGQLWNDVALIPKLQQAHEELQIKLRESAAPVTRKFYTEAVTATTLVFATPPADLIQPIALWEKAAGDPVTAWAKMTQADPLPDVAQAATMIWWGWFNEIVTFIGSSAARTIRMQYQCSLTLPTLNTDSIGFINGQLYLAPRTAAIAAGSVGNAAVMAALTALADQSMGAVILANQGRAMPVQSPTSRP